MDVVSLVGVLFPVGLAFVTLVIVLAKMHADIETIKEKIKVLFDLWNNKD
jgi:hypothetical protein